MNYLKGAYVGGLVGIGVSEVVAHSQGMTSNLGARLYLGTLGAMAGGFFGGAIESMVSSDKVKYPDCPEWLSWSGAFARTAFPASIGYLLIESAGKSLKSLL